MAISPFLLFVSYVFYRKLSSIHKLFILYLGGYLLHKYWCEETPKRDSFLSLLKNGATFLSFGEWRWWRCCSFCPLLRSSYLLLIYSIFEVEQREICESNHTNKNLVKYWIIGVIVPQDIIPTFFLFKTNNQSLLLKFILNSRTKNW